MTIFAERSERFEAWVAPFAPRSAPWRIAVGVLFAGSVWVAVLFGATALLRAVVAEPERLAIPGFLLSFGALILGFGLSMRLLHRLPGVRLLGPEERIEGGRLVAGALVVAGIVGLGFVPMLLIEAPERQLGFGQWAVWLPVLVPALFLQVTAEEVAFRGYLQGMLAARYRSRLVWWVLPAVAFGVLHWNPVNASRADAVLMVVAATLMGLVFGDVVARTGSLAPAIGLHFANNAFALLVMATEGPLSRFALYVSPIAASDRAEMRAALIGNIVLIAVAYGIFVAVWRWRARRRQ